MGIFGFLSWMLVTIAAVTLLFPLNVPVIALAYKIRTGQQPIDMEPREFWGRAALAAFGLAVLSLVLIGLAYGLIEGLDLPPGPVQMILLMAYVPVAVWYVFWTFALEDLTQALSLFLSYILVAGLPLLLLGRLTHVWSALGRAAPWLWSTTERAFLP